MSPEGPYDHEKENSLLWGDKVELFGVDARRVVAASCCGDVFQREQSAKRRRRLQQCREDDLLERALDLGWRFIFQKVTDLKRTAKIAQEWLQHNPVNVPEWASQNTDLNPFQHLWGDLKIFLLSLSGVE